MGEVITAHENLTNRKDFWWGLPLAMLVGGVVVTVYLTWAALQGAHYSYGPYLSPVYASPYVPDWWKMSPAFLLLWIPACFRATCYYGRKVYHRVAFGDPAGCAVEEPYRKDYDGESKLPFILNNLHRYFLYLALLLLALHWYELIESFVRESGMGMDRGHYFGLGTLILLADTLALTFYVGGCHSLRHIVGGGKRSLTGYDANSCSGCTKKCGKIRHGLWARVSSFNAFHNVWFWVSLFSIAFADLYIRLLSMHVISFDPHIIF